MPKTLRRVSSDTMAKEALVKSDVSSITTTLENLFVKNPAYTSSGVPMKVLQTQVALQLLKNEEKGEDTELWTKAGELINKAVAEEVAVKNSSGNIGHGPNAYKKNDSEATSDKDRKSPSASRTDGAVSPASQLFMEMEEDEDGVDEEDEIKLNKKQDKTYRPAGVKVTPPLTDSAASTRPRRRVPTHKGRYDSSEYVFPEYLRAYKKRKTAETDEKKAEKPGKPPKQTAKRKSSVVSPGGPQAKKNTAKSSVNSTSTTGTSSSTTSKTCSSPATTSAPTTTSSSIATQSPAVKCDAQTSISPPKMASATLSVCVVCKYLGPKNVSNFSMTGCVSCTAKAHKTCVDLKSRDRFICNACSTAKETTCCVCLGSRDQNQVQCSGCGCFYHRTCHTPPLEAKLKNEWICFKCDILKRASDPKYLTKVIIKQNSNSNSVGGNGGKIRHAVGLRRKSSVESIRGESIDVDSWENEEQSSDEPKKEYTESSSQTTLLDDNSEPSSKENGSSDRLSFIPLLEHPDLSIPDVTEWSTLDVFNYFQEKFTEDIALTFIEQDIDGCALKLIKKPDIVNMFKVKNFTLNVGIQVLLHVKKLQLRTKDLRIIWEDIDPAHSE